jgi:hypothetical protein
MYQLIVLLSAVLCWYRSLHKLELSLAVNRTADRCRTDYVEERSDRDMTYWKLLCLFSAKLALLQSKIPSQSNVKLFSSVQYSTSIPINGIAMTVRWIRQSWNASLKITWRFEGFRQCRWRVCWSQKSEPSVINTDSTAWHSVLWTLRQCSGLCITNTIYTKCNSVHTVG